MNFAIFSVALAALCAVAATAGSPYGFEAYNNFPLQFDCPSSAALLPWNRTVTGSMTLEWAFVVPTTGKRSNGGVPQAGNLSRHVASVRHGVEHRVTDANFSGNIVIDFEHWTPIWEQNTAPGLSWHSLIYQTISKEIVRESHPGIAGNETAVTLLAKAQFEKAALEWFVATVATITEMRPLARVGFYAVPQTYFSGGEHQKAWNEKLAPLWAASTALFPGVYGIKCPNKVDCRDNGVPWRHLVARGFRSVVNESVRLSQKFTSQGIPVLPFAWAITQGRPAKEVDVWSMVEAVWQPPGATRIVEWGTTTGGDVNRVAACNYTGPVLADAVKISNACSLTRCSGNGWCSAIGPVSSKTATCVCGAGWTGGDCSTAAN